jgi:ADP-ribose pyrophosphatase YjhB (NUDIX family)
MSLIHKAGLLLVRDGRMLLCRKTRDTGRLILPGGKFEKDESAGECLAREIREELGDVRLSAIEHIGAYSDEAAEPGKRILVELYSAQVEGAPVACSEIGELVWFGEADDRAQLAPSLTNKIIPDLVARRVLPWRK